jgi:outer membrane cobalamin receptor
MARFFLGVLTVLLALAAGTAPARGQDATGTIAGVVVDAENNTTLPLADVRLAETTRGTTTGQDGRFELANVAPGRRTVVASYVGFRTRRRTVEVEAGERVTLEIALQPRALEVGEVTVTADRVDEKDLAVTKITAAEIKELPAVLQPDLFRSLQYLPGIKSASDFSSGLYVRGGGPDQTLVLLDDAPIYNPTHVFGFFSTFNPDAIGDVTLYKGGYPAEYGGRLAGVVDINNRRSAPEETTGGLSLGMLSSRAYARGSYVSEIDTTDGDYVGTGTWSLAVRRSTIEPLLSALSDSGVEDIPQSFYFYDVNASATLDPTPDDDLFLSFYAGRDQLNFPFVADAVFDVGYGNRAATGAWRRQVTDRLRMRWSGSYSHYFSDPIAEIAGTRFVRDNDVYDLKLEGDLTWAATDQHVVDGGLTVGSFTSRLQNSFDGNENFSPRVRTAYGALHVQDVYNPTWSPDLTLTAGARLNWYRQGGYLRPAPRLRATYQLAPDVQLQAGYGRYYQYLSAATSQLFSAFDFWLTTGDQVPPSYGDQYLAGVKTDLDGGVSLNVEAYYRTMRDLFDLDRLKQDYTGLAYPELFQFGRGRAYGLEVTLRRRQGRLNGFLGYTLSRTEREFDQLSADPFPPRYDRTHDLTAVVNYDLADNWRLTSVFTYATGQAYTEPTSYYKLLDYPFSSQTLTPLRGEYNGARLPAYHRLDVSLRRKGTLFGADYEARVQMVNVYSRRNVWFKLYQPGGENNNAVTEDVVPQIPVPLPNLSVTFTF